MDFFDEIEQSLDEADAVSAQQRRDDRMRMCSKSAIVKERPDGGRSITYWFCKDPRCEVCNERKGKEYKERILNVIKAGDGVSMVSLPKDVADKFCRNVKRDNYLRLPQEKNDIIFFLSSNFGMKADDLDECDWTEIVRRKSSNIISGNLGKEIPEDSIGNFTVEVTDYVVYPYEKAYDVCMETATNIISWQQPETLEENQSYRDIFNAELAKRFMLNGVRIISIVKHKQKIQNFSINYLNIEKF